MAGGSINWYVVIPDPARNFVTNPSYEFGTAGWAGTATPTLGTSSASQEFGAWSLTATGATLGLGAATGVAQTAAGTAYTASAYVRLTGTNSAGSVQIGLGGTSFRTQIGTDWTRISVGSVGAVGSVAVQRYSGAEGTLWVDAVQVEVGSITTYVDGDQDGGVWEGAPHASASYRGAQTRSGGSVWPLATVGLRPQTTPDTGMAPASNILQSYAVNSGAEYQRGRYTERAFTLTATMTGTTLADQHVTRRRVIDAIKRERVTPDQPTRFLYTGAAGTQYIDAYYDAGLGWGGENVIADENAAVRFVAPDPMWYAYEQEGTSLAPYTVIGSVNYVAYRDPEGRWGTMGVAGTSINATSGNGTVRGVLASEGTVFVAGIFGTVGGTAICGNNNSAIAMWTPGGNWGTMGPGTIRSSGGVEGLYVPVRNPGGTVFIAGDLLAAAGTPANGVAMWTANGWGTLAVASGGGSATTLTRVMCFDTDGALVLGGAYTNIGGTTTNCIARWNGNWGTLTGGTINTSVLSLTRAPYGSLVIGVFTNGPTPGSVGGTQFIGAAQWGATNGWGTFPNSNLVGTAIYALAFDPAQQLYIGGIQSAPGTAMSVYRGNGGFAAGTMSATLVSGQGVRSLQPLPNGNIYAAGLINTINSSRLPINLGLALWNGYTWLPSDILIPTTTGDPQALSLATTGTLYMGGSFRGIGTAASVTTIATSGMAESYPTLRLRNNASGTARVYQLLNTTTGDSLWFDYVMVPGEIATLTTTPGNRSFTSSVRGNIFGAILGGSNIASWRLLPGTNTVSFLADNASVQADLFWTPRSSSIDGGAPGVI